MEWTISIVSLVVGVITIIYFIKEAKNRDLLNKINKIEESIKTTIEKVIHIIQYEINPLEEGVAKLSCLDDWRRDINTFQNNFGNKLNMDKNGWKDLNSSPLHKTLKTRAEEIRNILQSPSSQPGQGNLQLSDQLMELLNLQKKAGIDDDNIKSNSEQTEREKAREILNTSRNIVNWVLDRRLPRIKGDLENIGEALKRRREDFDRYTGEIAGLSPTPYKELEGDVMKIDKTITRYKKKLKSLQLKCKTKKLFLLLPWNWGKGGNQP